MIPANYHTHTQFCDGENNPEEMVREAIRLGCPELGFSGHSYTFFDESYCMSQAGTQEYITAIRALQEKYRDKISILLGVEQDYYEAVADLYQKTQCQIVGHFDLIKKFNGLHDLFDPQHPRYRAAANKALSALMSSPVALEVNTGGIAKGYIKEPYPAGDVLTQWLESGKPVLFASDCHNAEQLLFGYDIYKNYI